MNLDQLSQSDVPQKKSVLARLGGGFRAQVFAALVLMTGCSAHKAKPIVIEGLNKPKVSTTADTSGKEQVVQNACSKMGKLLAAGQPLPKGLDELTDLCDKKRALEIQIQMRTERNTTSNK